MKTRMLVVGMVVASTFCQMAHANVIYKAWLEEDVRWIITPQEAAAFKLLKNDAERDSFVQQFWLRRDPTPNTIENEFKEEHYRRLAYSNQHFASDKPGWAMDRGHFYIVFGPPDRIERARVNDIPSETWSYRYLEGVGQEKSFKFNDNCKCGRFSLEGKFPEPNAEHGNEIFEPLSNVSKTHSPPIRFKDLSELATHKIHYNLLAFDANAEFQLATKTTTITNLTLSIPRSDIALKSDGLRKTGRINIYGQVTSLGGRVAEFEDIRNTSDTDNLRENLQAESSIALEPGSYRLYVAIKDVNDAAKIGTRQWILKVPTFDDLNRQGLQPVVNPLH